MDIFMRCAGVFIATPPLSPRRRTYIAPRAKRLPAAAPLACSGVLAGRRFLFILPHRLPFSTRTSFHSAAVVAAAVAAAANGDVSAIDNGICLV
jgi:hypothetical protein